MKSQLNFSELAFFKLSHISWSSRDSSIQKKVRVSLYRPFTYLTYINRSSNCIGYRIGIVCLISTLSTILQHCTHTMNPSDPMLLADGTLRCRMYPAGKVAISRHLANPGFPQFDHTVSKLSLDAGSLCSEI